MKKDILQRLANCPPVGATSPYYNVADHVYVDFKTLEDARIEIRQLRKRVEAYEFNEVIIPENA